MEKKQHCVPGISVEEASLHSALLVILRSGSLQRLIQTDIVLILKNSPEPSIYKMKMNKSVD